MGLIAPVIASDRHVIVLRTEFVSFCLEFLHLRRKVSAQMQPWAGVRASEPRDRGSMRSHLTQNFSFFTETKLDGDRITVHGGG
jgi:hypothetical protein